MAISGADVLDIDTLSKRYELQAGKLREIVVSSTAALMVAEWTGGHIERVRSDWKGTAKPALLAIAQQLSSVATDLHKRAEDQRRVSSSASGSGAATVGRPGPGNATALVNDYLDWPNDDSVRIREVVGSDGKTRFIVSIPGTHGDLFKPDGQLGGAQEDPAAWLNLETPIRRRIVQQITDRLKGHEGAEVMLVGYSQGGMLAESISESGKFNVKEVITIGGPAIVPANDYGGANVMRLQHNSDAVVNITNVARLVLQPTSLLAEIPGDVGELIGAITGGDRHGVVQEFRGGSPFEALFEGGTPIKDHNPHGIPENDYRWLAEQYEESGDPAVLDARARQSVFLDSRVVADDSYTRD
jgi:pimeloyl-ACP methyl ester carboxylesterase